jgi:hypothetical protein
MRAQQRQAAADGGGGGAAGARCDARGGARAVVASSSARSEIRRARADNTRTRISRLETENYSTRWLQWMRMTN